MLVAFDAYQYVGSSGNFADRCIFVFEYMLDMMLYRHSYHCQLPPRLVAAESKEVFFWSGGHAFLILDFPYDIFAGVLCTSIVPKTHGSQPRFCSSLAGTPATTVPGDTS